MRRPIVPAILGLALLALAGWGLIQLSQSRTPPSRVARQIKEQIREKDIQVRASSPAEAAANWKLVQTFYDKRKYRPAWTDGRGPLPQAKELIEAVAASGADGLSPADYDPTAIAEEIDSLARKPLADAPPAAELASLDIRLTYTSFQIANHLVNGRISPRMLDPDWRTGPHEVDLVAHLERAVESRRIGEALAELPPLDPRYRRLREAWMRYAKIIEEGGWPAVPGRGTIRRGSQGSRVEALARRLKASEDLGGEPSPRFDGALEGALRRFQARHGLGATGIVDGATLAALNVPAEARLRQIQLNLERWRWLPRELGSRYVMVNIPDFRLDVFEADQSVLRMAVVVGKRMSPTPTFSDRAVAVEVNPYWNIPQSIARNEIAPLVAKDPAYLSRNHIRALSKPGEEGEEIEAGTINWSDTASVFALRQDPGPDNPLGKIKIALPNEYDVYLHDTPAGHLFDAKERDFSHGCIRVEKPVELATYLLRGSEHGSRESLEALLREGANRWIPLPEEVRVHILYWTAWAESDGTVQVRNDIYGHDARLDTALRNGSISSLRINAPS